MFKVKVNQDIIQYCKNQVDKYNFGKRSSANGNKEQQLTGIIGQSVVMNLFGLGNVNGEDGFDDGVDILYNNKKIDVKTMGRNVDAKMKYVNNFLSCQLKYDCDVLIFVSINKQENTFQICGWIEKKNLHRKSIFYEKGERRYRDDGTYFQLESDTYEIYNYNLIDMKYLDEINKQT